MHSHLTRLVFRKLLASDPIAHAGCLRRSLPCRNLLCPGNAAVTSIARTQRRQFFNIFTKPPRQAVEPNMDPGLDKMMEYAKMERLQARLPPPDQIAHALNDFFAFKKQHQSPLEDLQAQYALQSLNYLRACKEPSFVPLTLKSSRNALELIAARSQSPSSAHVHLALAIYDCHKERCISESRPVLLLKPLLKALCQLGSTTLARQYLLDFTPPDPTENASEKRNQIPPRDDIDYWSLVLGGFIKERNHTEVLETLQLMEQHRLSNSLPIVCKLMVAHYATLEDPHNAKIWYDKLKTPIGSSARLREEAQELLLQLCMRTSQIDLGQSIIRDIMAATPSKRQRDLIFEWAAGLGKGVDEIDRMMGVLERANQGTGNFVDHDTINRLVKLAIARNDPYMAERFITLGRKRGIEPDAYTLVLQIDYRLSVNDIDGALVAYKHLQAEDIPHDHDVDAVNNLITAMCTSGRHDFDSIMNVAADLSDRRARFEPKTVSALSLLHLSRNEIDDVLDLLNTHVFKFSAAERASVQDTLVYFCKRESTTTAQAWDTYLVLKRVFDEANREQRTVLMDEFFRRQRADMAVHVFNHMRSHTRADTIPTIETYISCFLGIAHLKDQEGLDVVHNQMKLDYTIEPNTRLYNCLILAYTACRAPRRGLKLWDMIVTSREGPTISSIHLALRACEISPWGDEKAREIWTLLVQTGIDLEDSLWGSYAAALVGNGNVQGTIKELEEAQAKGTVEMSAFV